MVNQVYVSTLVGNIISFVTGAALTWSSPTLPKLNATEVDDIPFGRQITADENSWIGSLLALGAIFGPPIFGYSADKFGRKLTLLSLAVPYLISFLILAFAKIVPLYYVARILIGFAVGGVFTVMPMYVGEISQGSNRGALSSMLNILLTGGMAFSYCVGPYVSIMIFNIILAVFPAIYIALFLLLVPESPYYHVAKGDLVAAARSLSRLRDKSDNNEIELTEIKQSVEKQSKGNFKDLFRSKGLIKALITSLALMVFQQMSGINAVLFYAQTIFEASGSGLEPEDASIIIGIVQFATSFITPLVIDRLGRKMLLYFSTIGMVIAEVPLGVYFYMKDHGHDVDSISWLPVFSLVLYIITYNAGMGPLPWIVMGEIFPTNVKAVASSLTAMFSWFLAFLITKLFQSLVDGIGMGSSFWLFTAFCAVGFFFTLFYIIETKGKSLQEVQDILES